MKKIISTIITFIIAIIATFSLVACGDTTSTSTGGSTGGTSTGGQTSTGGASVGGGEDVDGGDETTDDDLTGVEPILVEAEGDHSLLFKADDTSYAKPIQNGSGSSGGFLHSLDNFPNNGYFKLTVTTTKAGKYSLSMRAAAMAQGSGGRGTNNLANIFEVSTDGTTYSGVTGTIYPSITFAGSDWQNYYNWSVAVLGDVDLKLGENTVYIKKIATWAPRIDWFKFSPTKDTVTGNEVVSLRENGFTFTQNEDLAYAKVGTWTVDYTGIYIRMELTNLGATYYDAMITVAELQSAGVSTAEKGTFTKTLTFSNSAIESSKVFSADITYTVE